MTLLTLTERTATDLDAQKGLFGRFTKEQPHVTFELSPNGPNQAARDRVKVMAQAGTPPDFWETTCTSAPTAPDLASPPCCPVSRR